MSADYEYSRRLTIGGANGTYTIESPWNGPCEWALHSLSFSGAGGVCITDQDMGTGGTVSVSASSATANATSPYPGILLWFTAAAVLAPDAIFTPLPGNKLTIAISGLTANTTGLVCVVFRRPAVINTTFPRMMTVNPEDEHAYHRAAAQEAQSERAETGWDVAPAVRSNHRGR